MGWDRNRRGGYYGWPEYVPVAERKKKALKQIAKMKKKGFETNPVQIEGRNIANTFWGKAWCTNLESYSDFENRLPRGRTYVRNGSVLDLGIEKGQINALVNGSSLYKINITITPVQNKKWQTLVNQCAGKIDSLIELLQGKFSKAVMEIITHKQNGLFPQPKEIEFDCSCPDSANMCKHIAAALYGIGSRLDFNPEQLFLLRHVDHTDLISVAEATNKLTPTKSKTNKKVLADSDLSSIFGIDVDAEPVAVKKSGIKTKKKVTVKKTKKLLTSV